MVCDSGTVFGALSHRRASHTNFIYMNNIKGIGEDNETLGVQNLFCLFFCVLCVEIHGDEKKKGKKIRAAPIF